MIPFHGFEDWSNALVWRGAGVVRVLGEISGRRAAKEEEAAPPLPHGVGGVYLQMLT